MFDDLRQDVVAQFLQLDGWIGSALWRKVLRHKGPWRIGDHIAHAGVRALSHVQIAKMMQPVGRLLFRVHLGKLFLGRLLPCLVLRNQALELLDTSQNRVVIRAVRDLGEGLVPPESASAGFLGIRLTHHPAGVFFQLRKGPLRDELGQLVAGGHPYVGGVSLPQFVRGPLQEYSRKVLVSPGICPAGPSRGIDDRGIGFRQFALEAIDAEFICIVRKLSPSFQPVRRDRISQTQRRGPSVRSDDWKSATGFLAVSFRLSNVSFRPYSVRSWISLVDSRNSQPWCQVSPAGCRLQLPATELPSEAARRPRRKRHEAPSRLTPVPLR